MHPYNPPPPMNVPNDHLNVSEKLAAISAHRSLPSWFLIAVLLTNQARAEDWPRWGGPRGDGTWRGPKLAETWPAAGLRVEWTRGIGGGYGGTLGARGGGVPMGRQTKPRGSERGLWFDA